MRATFATAALAPARPCAARSASTPAEADDALGASELGWTSPTTRRPGCRTARSSASSSPARCAAGPRCCCSTSRPAASPTPRSTSSATCCSSCASDFDLTVLLVEHHMGMVMRISDHVVVLNFGRQIAEGPPDEVQQRPGRHRGLPGDGASEPARGSEASTPATARACVLHGVDFDVDEGRSSSILGANGAGKTTTLRALSGMVATHGQHPLRRRGARRPRARRDRARRHRARARGPRHVHRPDRRGEPARRRLRAPRRGRRAATSSAAASGSRAWASAAASTAGSLSGGEQQMLAVARALMLRPRLLLLDEPSLGLAPLVTRELFQHPRDDRPRGGHHRAGRRAERQPRPAASPTTPTCCESGRIALEGDADTCRPTRASGARTWGPER